jgi:hypothetical protein
VMDKLIVDGIVRELGVDWTLRFTESPIRPVLYYKGKRVTKSWSIFLSFDSPSDPFDNANTADI